ncbi:hypothetical protein MOBT1_003357 [Malassezia obtusa]|uniref:Succinate dehydrogenase assembly factor 4, mitochondrial n=1 Tax=Malassezia obtusa TaxID=76774 RepID=A0AAF0E1L1_9BASI|nr:hypothetical protein MOBT1_003357 [Malassezia obtusa]
MLSKTSSNSSGSCAKTKVGGYMLMSDKSNFVAEDEEGNAVNMHPDALKGPGADFDGDTNPDTGEIGGPKKDPLRWKSEWTYGGRAIDF